MTEEQWLACADPDELIKWLARGKRRRPSDRKFRLFGCACCRRLSHLLAEQSRREAVEFAERYADGLESDSDLQEATLKLFRTGVGAIIWSLWFSSTTSDVTRIETATRSTAAYAAIRAPDQEKEKAAQSDLLRCLVGNPFLCSSFDLELRQWSIGATVVLAQEMYDSRDFSKAPLLADMLEDAGCTDPQILQHLRGPGPHVRGCWVVDLLLDKG